jgi:phosphohistidine phosphatase SixA
VPLWLAILNLISNVPIQLVVSHQPEVSDRVESMESGNAYSKNSNWTSL